MKNVKQLRFTYKGHSYPYDLYLGGVKRLNLRVRPDGSIRVSAPRMTSQRAIDDFLTCYGDKIAQAVLRAKQLPSPSVPAISPAEKARKKEAFPEKIMQNPGNISNEAENSLRSMLKILQKVSKYSKIYLNIVKLTEESNVCQYAQRIR